MTHQREITLTPAQFMALQRLPIDHPLDTRIATVDLRNLGAHITALETILGRERVNAALATGESITIRVDWSRREGAPAKSRNHR